MAYNPTMRWYSSPSTTIVVCMVLMTMMMFINAGTIEKTIPATSLTKTFDVGHGEPLPLPSNGIISVDEGPIKYRYVGSFHGSALTVSPSLQTYLRYVLSDTVTKPSVLPIVKEVKMVLYRTEDFNIVWNDALVVGVDQYVNVFTAPTPITIDSTKAYRYILEVDFTATDSIIFPLSTEETRPGTPAQLHFATANESNADYIGVELQYPWFMASTAYTAIEGNPNAFWKFANLRPDSSLTVDTDASVDWTGTMYSSTHHLVASLGFNLPFADWGSRSFSGYKLALTLIGPAYFSTYVHHDESKPCTLNGYPVTLKHSMFSEPNDAGSSSIELEIESGQGMTDSRVHSIILSCPHNLNVIIPKSLGTDFNQMPISLIVRPLKLTENIFSNTYPKGVELIELQSLPALQTPLPPAKLSTNDPRKTTYDRSSDTRCFSIYSVSDENKWVIGGDIEISYDNMTAEIQGALQDGLGLVGGGHSKHLVKMYLSLWPQDETKAPYYGVLEALSTEYNSIDTVQWLTYHPDQVFVISDPAITHKPARLSIIMEFDSWGALGGYFTMIHAHTSNTANPNPPATNLKQLNPSLSAVEMLHDLDIAKADLIRTRKWTMEVLSTSYLYVNFTNADQVEQVPLSLELDLIGRRISSEGNPTVTCNHIDVVTRQMIGQVECQVTEIIYTDSRITIKFAKTSSTMNNIVIQSTDAIFPDIDQGASAFDVSFLSTTPPSPSDNQPFVVLGGKKFFHSSQQTTSTVAIPNSQEHPLYLTTSSFGNPLAVSFTKNGPLPAPTNADYVAPPPAKKQMSNGVIVGIIFGALALFVLLCVFFCWLRCCCDRMDQRKYARRAAKTKIAGNEGKKGSRGSSNTEQVTMTTTTIVVAQPPQQQQHQYVQQQPQPYAHHPGAPVVDPYGQQQYAQPQYAQQQYTQQQPIAQQPYQEQPIYHQPPPEKDAPMPYNELSPQPAR